MNHRDEGNEDQGKHKGHDKPKKKDERNEDATWCIEDVEWDENGCLYVKNPELAQQIYDAIWVDKSFCITRDNPDYDPLDPSGGGGGQKGNIQCPC